MKKDPKATDIGRPYRLAHQTVCIKAFNFERQSLIGYVELLIHPLKPDLKRIKINSKQCRLYRVSVNDNFEAAFLYNDPTLEICQGDAKQRNLDYFENCHSTAMNAVDPDSGNGEVTIRLPLEVLATILELKPFRVCIEFSLEQPKGGLKFVVPDEDGIEGTLLDVGAHLFTYGHENSARLWFPCIDSYNEVCTWKLEYSVDMYMTAVSCGDLIETVYTPDLRKKTYHYFLGIPTAAPNIALAVGPFEVLVDPYMHEVTHFCLPHMMPLLRQSTDFLHEVFEFYEELMSSRYPYSCYKQVFVDQAYQDSQAYATMSIFSTNIFYSKKIIDQIPLSRYVMAHAIAQQFFGTFITMNAWCDAWLPKGIAAYLGSLYRRKSFGNNEYRHQISQELKEVQEYEANIGGIVLDPAMTKETNSYFPIKNPHTLSPKYADVYEKKAHLVIRMLDIRIGRELLLQAFNKLLSLAQNASQQKFTSNTWSNMLLSTSSFLKGLSTVTGKDINTFIEQWAHQSGCARFRCSFVFNRKRNVVELEMKQEMVGKGTLKYVGPLTVALQELDGTFNHTFKIEENKTKFEITCHSKSRRNKKKKIPLCTQEEVDMDLGAMDADSPVLWMRVDPEMTILRQVQLEQIDYMWQYMLKYERDIVAQLDAIKALESFPTPATRKALTDTMENEHCFYQLRMEAGHCLSRVANAMVASWAGPPAMMTIFRKMFGSHSCPDIVRQNNFTNFQHYHMQKAIPIAMATLRTVHNICPPEVLHFLLDLFKYNDNSKNKYSDNYYRAALIDALANTITPAVTTVTITGMGPSTDSLTSDTRLILEELTRYLNMEKLLPCYKLTITCSCLRAIRKMQKYGHLPPDCDIFKSYAIPGNFTDVRLAAMEALVDYTKVEQSKEMLNWLLDRIEEDPEPYVSHKVLCMMAENPPFTKLDECGSPLSSEDLVEKIWKMMNKQFSHDSRLRCDIADLYFALYGRTRPSCVPIPDSVVVLNLKEKSTKMNASMQGFEESMDADDFMHGPMAGLPQQMAWSSSPMISPHSLNLKRGPDSPLQGLAGHLESSHSGVMIEQHEDIYKVRAKSDHEDGMGSPTLDVVSDSPHGSSAASTLRQTYTNEFMRFAGIPPQPAASQEITVRAPPLPEMQHSPSLQYATQSSQISRPLLPSVSSLDQEVSRLSEDSLSDDEVSQQPKPIDISAALSMAPTSFDSSMFPTASSTGTPSPAMGTAPSASGEESHSKVHKVKKKKKKNKKHKHKHKHEKNEKGDKPLKTDKGPLASIILEHPLSSDASNANSPFTQNQPSSPEFETM